MLNLRCDTLPMMTKGANEMETTQAKAIADTILAQLGNGRFIAMTGAKNFLHDENGKLSFQYPRRKGFKVSGVRIALNVMDTYDVTFVDMKRDYSTVEKTIENVYADQLQRVFTAETGLDTHL